MTSGARQLQALLLLRWQMTRAPGARLATVLGGAFVVWLLVQALRVGPLVGEPVLAAAVEVAPAASFAFGALAVLAPSTTGGARLFPVEQLAAYPVRPSAHVLGSLLLAPLNPVWLSHLLGLAALTSCLTLGGDLLRGAVVTVAYVCVVTVLGQLGAWVLLGMRRTRAGRRSAAALCTSSVVLGVLLLQLGAVSAVFARSPTYGVVDGIIAGGDGRLGRWAGTTAVLLLAAGVGLVLSWRACRWALHRPGDTGAPVAAPVRRRRTRSTVLGQLVSVERRSAWRAPGLRRGALVIAVLPGLLASGAALPWSSLVVLPGLVAAGTALLFGINAFGLDGGGALWLASLPHDPAIALRAKAVVLGETVLGTVLLASVTGSLRSSGTPTAAEAAALLSAVVLCTASVVAVALSMSVRRPHAADLDGPGDAIVPPGALLIASTQLALPTVAAGMLLGLAGSTGVWWLPPALTLPLLGLCALSASRTSRRWADPVQRALVVHTVANG